MALSTDPTYITYEEFKLYTRVTAQVTMDDDDIKPFLLYAEDLIDAYIGYIKPYSSDQDRKFPTIDSDGESYLPDNIKRACIEITSDQILKGAPTSNEGSSAVKSEAWSSSSYSRTLGEKNNNKSISSELPAIAINLLRKWNGSVAGATY